MNVIPFNRNGSEPPREAAHIDRTSLVELLRVFFRLSGYIEGESDLRKLLELYRIANQLASALHQFIKPPQDSAAELERLSAQLERVAERIAQSQGAGHD